MPVITDIKKQRRRETRYSVHVDGRYSFALSDLELSTSSLRVGQELTEAELAEHQDQAQAAKAYAAALRLLSLRSRSRREVTDYLARKGYSEQESREALERLEDAGLVNDREFAASWVANRGILRPRSRRILAQELAAKGVSREDIEAELSAIDGEAELAAALQVAQKKQRLTQYADRQKLTDYLLRQGYPYGVVKQALELLD